MNPKFFPPSLWKRPTGTQLLILLIVLLSLLVVLDLRRVTLLFPLLASALVSGGLGFAAVPVLRGLKAGQVVREDGPRSHLKKTGTPTMGGIFFVPTAALVALSWSRADGQVVAITLLTLAYAAIGWLDDWQILRRKSNKGISARAKLLLQVSGAIVFCIWMWWSGVGTDIILPGGWILPLEIFFWVLAGFILVAESNATNLTDGVDGLAGGTASIAFLSMGIIVGSEYPGPGIFCACFSGACLGFLLHNRNPARVFMGDTGSLALGGGLAAVGLVSGSLWGLWLSSGLFFLESVSVIAQVSYYKATKDESGKGKRLFKMAPFHHHLELSGWTETRVVGVFYLVNALLAAAAIRTS